MGLCKCPQRKVTNIFCYEHRVNVCEHCLMQNHPKCVVDTYRNWITDSVFSPKCTLCSEDLVNGETVRLLCFHIVHWACLDSWARSLPATTAPAGYTCPVCKTMCLFPALNQVSPIADSLRSKMSDLDWARAGLGLSLLDNGISASPALTNGNAIQGNTDGHPNKTIPEAPSNHYTDRASPTSPYSAVPPGTHVTSPVMNSSQNHVQPSTSYPTNHTPYTPPTPKSYFSDVGDTSPNANPRKPVSKYDYEVPLLFDEEEHKYRRKSPFEALSRWLKNANPTSNRRKSRRRTIIYAIVTIIVLIVMFMILFGRNEEYDDGFDPKLNPNVLIGDREAIGKGAGQEDS